MSLVFAGAVTKYAGLWMLVVKSHDIRFTDYFHETSSQQTVFSERIDLPATDNQMVRDTDIHQLKYLYQPLREGFIGLAGGRLTGRMVRPASS